MYYSAGLAGLTAFTGAVGLPCASILWIMARISPDSAGGLFGLYLTVMAGLLLTGRAMPFRRRAADRMSRPPA